MNNFLLHRFPMRCNSHQRWTLSPLQKLDRLTALHPFTAVANTRLLQIIRVLRKYSGQNPAAWGAAFKYVWPSDSNKNKSGKRSKRGLGRRWRGQNIKTNPENGHNCHRRPLGWSAHGKRKDWDLYLLYLLCQHQDTISIWSSPLDVSGAVNTNEWPKSLEMGRRHSLI